MIGKFIYDILIDATYSTGAQPTGIFPVVADQGANMPLIVYGISGANGNETKTSTSMFDVYTVDITCLAATYNTVNVMSEAVRTAIDRYTNYAIPGTSLIVNSVRFTDLNDVYFDDLKAYGQELTFDFIIQR